MSTVLWANYLVDDRVTSEESDKTALHRFSKKLDRLTRQLGVTPFLAVQDTTDAEFNLSGRALPEGMESTDELMAREGVWVSASSAVEMLEALLRTIRDQDIRFGLVANAQEQVLAELSETLEFAKKAEALSARFNLAVVT